MAEHASAELLEGGAEPLISRPAALIRVALSDLSGATCPGLSAALLRSVFGSEVGNMLWRGASTRRSVVVRATTPLPAEQRRRLSPWQAHGSGRENRGVAFARGPGPHALRRSGSRPDVAAGWARTPAVMGLTRTGSSPSRALPPHSSDMGIPISVFTGHSPMTRTAHARARTAHGWMLGTSAASRGGSAAGRRRPHRSTPGIGRARGADAHAAPVMGVRAIFGHPRGVDALVRSIPPADAPDAT